MAWTAIAGIVHRPSEVAGDGLASCYWKWALAISCTLSQSKARAMTLRTLILSASRFDGNGIVLPGRTSF